MSELDKKANLPVWDYNRRVSARLACQAFAGTPHHSRMAIPGTGVDCVHFVMFVLQAAGLLPKMTLPSYDDRIGRLRERNIIEDLLTEHLHCERTASPDFGDILVCRCGRETNHVGIVIDGEFWHVPGRGRCGPEALANWLPRTQCFLRITAPGLKADPALLTAAGILARQADAV